VRGSRPTADTSRPYLDELGPELRDRILALDEPVARDDWADVVRRARTHEPRPRVARAASALAVVAFLAAMLVGLRSWAGAGAPPGPMASPTSATALGGQPTSPGPLSVAWHGRRVSGMLSSSSLDSVTIRFTDGTSAKPRIRWVSLPFAAGVFDYDIPPGKTVAGVSGSGWGQAPRQVTWYSV
jgi:hypothetical protein